MMTADAHEILVDRAEQAVLGALLLRPDVFQDISYLDPTQFVDPPRAALFDAIRAELAQDPNQSSTDLAFRLQAVATTIGRRPDFEALIDACPDPGGVAAYARMVVEADFERTMTSHADRLWRDSEPESQQRAEAFVLDRLPLQVSADAEDAPIPGSWKGSRSNQEEHILADLIQHPDEFHQLPDSTKSDSFSADTRSKLYEALNDIHSRGEPVDKLTVAWELDRLQRNDFHAETGVDPVAYVDRLVALPVEPGTSTQLAEGLAAAARRATEHEQAAARHSRPGYGPRAQEHVISRDVGRHQTPEPEHHPPTYQPPSPGIDRDEHGPRMGL
jgi:hypothetical protein